MKDLFEVVVPGFLIFGLPIIGIVLALTGN